MAKTDPKKPNFPSKSCPKCHKFIHIKVKKHDECGWVMDGSAATSSVASKPQAKPAPSPTKDKPISKMEAVRRILHDQGRDIKPLEIQDQLKKKFHIKMDATVISTYKGTILKGASGKKPGRPKGKKLGHAKASPGTTTTGISLEDIRAVKHLADKIGAEKIRELAGVLAK